MQTIIVSDIFGRTKALEKLASLLSSEVDIFDPYDSEIKGFANESEAYSFFTSEVGIDKYSEKLSEFVQSIESELKLIGFSIGAAAIWKISGQKNMDNISSATCFYGSQIRNFNQVVPLFPIKLIFPAFEEHFSVSELMATLSGMENVTIKQVPFLHGFMNQHSVNYDQRGYNQEIQALCKSAI